MAMRAEESGTLDIGCQLKPPQLSTAWGARHRGDSSHPRPHLVHLRLHDGRCMRQRCQPLQQLAGGSLPRGLLRLLCLLLRLLLLVASVGLRGALLLLLWGLLLPAIRGLLCLLLCLLLRLQLRLLLRLQLRLLLRLLVGSVSLLLLLLGRRRLRRHLRLLGPRDALQTSLHLRLLVGRHGLDQLHHLPLLVRRQPLHKLLKQGVLHNAATRRLCIAVMLRRRRHRLSAAAA